MWPGCPQRAGAAALIGLAVWAGVTAQAPPVAAPQFRSRVDLVHLDVSVLDHDRRPVRGLTATDFLIFEDGRPQTVAAFSAVDLPDPPVPSTPWLRDVAPDVRRNTELADRRLVIIVMDDATIPFDPAMIRSAQEIGRLAIERLGPGDLASVVFTRDNRHAQELTSDKARLLQAVGTFAYGGRTIGLPGGATETPPAALGLIESQAFLQSIGTLDRVAETLIDVPQRRKAVIFVSVGVPVDPAAASEVRLISPDDDGAVEMGAMFRQLLARLSDTYRRAQRANVNVYSVSPAGVGGMMQYLQSQRWSGRFVPDYETPLNYTEFLAGLAENTGGRSFPDRNEFPSALTEIFQENGSYYLLGYQPAGGVDDGKFRRIDVRVARPGLTVRTRSGYYAGTPIRPAESATGAPALTTALSGLLPKTDVPLDVTAAPFAVPGKAEAAVVVVLTVHEDLPARPSRTTQDVDLQIAAFTQDGSLKASERLKTKVTLRPGPAGPAEYEVLSQVTLRPGRYQLRLSVQAGARTGSVYYDVDVPDFRARPVSISGLVLTSDPRPVSTAMDRLASVLTIAPTARRVFQSTDRVTLFAQIYQDGRDPGVPTTLAVRITDATGAVRVNRSEAVAGPEAPRPVVPTRGRAATAPANAAAGTDRSIDFRFDLPMRGLPPGEYLVTLEASAARGTARRDVRFVVR